MRLQHAHRIDGRPPLIERIGLSQAWAKTLEIDLGDDLAQIMILRDRNRENQAIPIA
jgi:hypothetical protein